MTLGVFFYITILKFLSTIKSFSQDIMKKELNKKSNQVTVLVQGSYTVDSDRV